MAIVRPQDVSVVVVNYNTKDALRRCIDSIDFECELIVVDNGSIDGSLEMLRGEKRIKLIEVGCNIGFGPANNRGISMATRQLVLLLNSDAWATAGAIGTLAGVFEREGVVAAGGKLLNPDGSVQQSCANDLSLWAVFCEQLWLEKAFRRSSVLSPYWMTRRLLALGNGPHEVAQVMGACLMFRPLEVFDERFFLYCEDTELCRRLRSHGKILYAPEASFYHELGTSSARFRWRAVAMYNCGKELYFRIHRGSLAWVTCLLLDRVGALLRLIAWTFPTMLTLGAGNRARVLSDAFYRVLVAPSSYKGLKDKG